jgi:hypothetical protein
MAATSLQRSKTALGAAFRRIARHKGGAVAVFAIARKLSQLIYRMLRYGQDYVDIGEKAYEAQFEAHPPPRLPHGGCPWPRIHPRPGAARRWVSFRSARQRLTAGRTRSSVYSEVSSDGCLRASRR